MRDSPGLDIACRLHDLGAHATVYDPMAMGNALEASPQLTYADSALELARDADAVLVATAWPEFAGISPSRHQIRRRVHDGSGCLPRY